MTKDNKPERKGPIEYGSADELFDGKERIQLEAEAVAIGTRDYVCECHGAQRMLSLALVIRDDNHVLEVGVPVDAVPFLMAGLMAQSAAVHAKNAEDAIANGGVAKQHEPPAMHVDWDKAAKA